MILHYSYSHTGGLKDNLITKDKERQGVTDSEWELFPSENKF